MNDVQLTPAPDASIVWSGDAQSRDQTDIDTAVGWLAERYVMSDRFARLLLSQLARQDGVTEPEAARSLVTTYESSTPRSSNL